MTAEEEAQAILMLIHDPSMTTPNYAAVENAIAAALKAREAELLRLRAERESLVDTLEDFKKRVDAAECDLKAREVATWKQAIESVNNIHLPAIASAQYAYTREGIQLAVEALESAAAQQKGSDK